MNCEEAKANLTALCSGDLSDADREATEAHAASCASCAAERREMAEVWAALASVPAAGLPKGCAVRFQARLRAESAPRRARRWAGWAAAAAVLLGVGLASLWVVSERSGAGSAAIVAVLGDVEVSNPGEGAQKAEPGQSLRRDGLLAVGGVGLASLRFDDGSELTLNPSTEVVLAGGRDGSRFGLRMTKGSLKAAVAPGKERFIIETPAGSITVLGTEFTVQLDERRGDMKGAAKLLTVAVLAGSVLIENPLGSVRLQAGEAGEAAEVGAPVKGPDVKPLCDNLAKVRAEFKKANETAVPPKSGPGRIVGVVADANGQPVPNAEIVALSLKDGKMVEVKAGKANEGGEFNFADLEPGVYTLKAESWGCKMGVTAVEVGPGQEAGMGGWAEFRLLPDGSARSGPAAGAMRRELPCGGLPMKQKFTVRETDTPYHALFVSEGRCGHTLKARVERVGQQPEGGQRLVPGSVVEFAPYEWNNEGGCQRPGKLEVSVFDNLRPGDKFGCGAYFENHWRMGWVYLAERGGGCEKPEGEKKPGGPNVAVAGGCEKPGGDRIQRKAEITGRVTWVCDNPAKGEVLLQVALDKYPDSWKDVEKAGCNLVARTEGFESECAKRSYDDMRRRVKGLKVGSTLTCEALYREDKKVVLLSLPEEKCGDGPPKVGGPVGGGHGGGGHGGGRR